MKVSRLFYSKKFYFSLILIVLGLWLVNSFIPTDSCTQSFYGAVHWDSCEGMSNLVNILYVVFQAITLITTVFLGVQTYVLFRNKFKVF